MKAVGRSYCIFVLLGKPSQRPFRTLARFCFGACTVWLTARVPFWARLLGVMHRPLPKEEDLLLWELERLAAEYEGKMLTLVPLSHEAKQFVKNNRSILETSYRTERKTT